MSIKISVETLEATYELLRTTDPFKRWKLPHADEISFRISRDNRNRGEFHVDKKGIAWITANENFHHTLDELMRTVAHEMCHLHEHLYGVRQDIQHGAHFYWCAARVCKHHQFDRGAF